MNNMTVYAGSLNFKMTVLLNFKMAESLNMEVYLNFKDGGYRGIFELS
jgi:hypothetical protein